MTPPTTATRAYDSSRRREGAAATRAEVLAAATRLFVERGWARTSVRDIAKEARVSVETVYATVGSKAEVLRAALEVGVVGDDEPIPLADRPEFRALGTGSATARSRAVADLLGEILARTSPLFRALEHGAFADAALHQTHVIVRTAQRETARQVLLLLTGREPAASEVDSAHALFADPVYLQLTEFAGWTNQDYRDWVAGTIPRLFDLRED